MRYLGLLSICVLTLFVVSACASFSGTSKQETAGESHVGTQGIDFNFVSNYPPAIIYTEDGDTGNNIILEVRNLGTFDASAWIYLSGFDPSILQVTGGQSSYTGLLKGKSSTNPEGGYTQVQFPSYGSLIVRMPKNIDIYPATIQATVCYDYETRASLPVCVDPNPYGPVSQKACIPHGASVGGGQGAPVAITSVEQESLKGKTIFKIRIANVGGGEVIQQGYYSQCTDQRVLTYDKFDKIEVTGIKLGGAGGQCSPANYDMRLVNNQALVTCVFNVAGALPYTTTLDVNLRYGYMDSKQRSIQIKKIS